MLRRSTKVIDDDPWFNFIILSVVSPHFSNRKLDMHDEWQWLFLPSIKENLIVACEALDAAFARGATEKLLYIGNILKITDDVHDTKVKLLLLTSILEMMLTHNPDFNRFNIEDSINKQFQLKTAVLMYMNDSSTDLANLKLRLKEIYQVRSNIAHGNFGGMSKMIKAAQRKGDDLEDPLEKYVNNLYQFVRVAVGAYLKDMAFVEFLKES